MYIHVCNLLVVGNNIQNSVCVFDVQDTVMFMYYGTRSTFYMTV